MESTSSSAVKVGIFFILGMAILAALTFRIEKFTEWGNYYDLIAYFKEAKGLEAENDVTLAGTKVGYVKAVAVEGDRIKVVLSIKEDIPIRKGSKASIMNDFLLGKSHVNITLASVSHPAYNAGESIETIDSPSLSDMLTKADNVLVGLQDITETLKDTKELLNSLKIAGRSLREIGPKANKLLASTLSIAEKINTGQGTLGKLITDATLINKIDSAMDSIQRILANNEQNINNALAGFGELGPQLKDALASLSNAIKPITEKNMMANLSEASESLKNILKKIEQGEGALPKLITSDELYVELKKLLDDLRETVQSYREQIPVGAFGSIVFSAF